MLDPGNLFPSNTEMKENTPLIDPAMDVRQRSLGREAEGGGAIQPPLSAAPSGTRLRDLAMDKRCLFLIMLFVASSLLYLTVTSIPTVQKAEPTLSKVYVVFRHGTRAPGFTYKNDPYNKDDARYWPNGPGELTSIGKMEGYELGERLRERYQNFIGDYYKPKEFRAFTTLIERTMMSAQLVLASFFPPQGYQEWSNGMNWQPVPVYPEVIVNATSASSCPRFTVEFKRNVKLLVPSDFGFETEVGKTLKEHAGEPDALPISLFTRVWDTVYFQDRAHLEIPEWLKPIYPAKMAVAAVKYLKFYLAGSRTQELLTLDPFGRALTSYFTESPRKMEIHSLHDIHIMTMFLLLGIEENSFPEPGSAIAIELHDKNEGQYFEVYYYPSPYEKVPVQKKMPCGMSCPISELIKRCKAYEAENYEQLCNSGEGAATGHVTEFKLPI